MKKKVLSPYERLPNMVNGNYIKTPIKKIFWANKEMNTIEVDNLKINLN